jgi:hypothetical protein
MPDLASNLAIWQLIPEFKLILCGASDMKAIYFNVLYYLKLWIF